MGMKTRGTNPEELRVMTDSQLRSTIVAASLDVAQIANRPGSSNYDILFAIGTLNRIEREARIREVDERALPASEAADSLLP